MRTARRPKGAIKARRTARRAASAKPSRPVAVSARLVAVNPGALAPYSSYGAPDFALRGYYADRPFKCRECGKEEVWTADQQKWWYEVAKGYVYSSATRCRACRRREWARRAEAKRVHLEGVARKKSPG